jgi:hypothetical protein
MALIQSVHNGNFLTFDDVKHKYTLNGEHVPGVTTVGKGGYPESFMLSNWKVGQGAKYVSSLLQRLGREHPLKIGDKLNEEIIKRAKKAPAKEAKKAADVGTVVHDYAYLTELGRIGEAMQMLQPFKRLPQWEKINNGIVKFESWHKENEDEIVGSEQIVASIDYSFGGKFDRLSRRGGVLTLSDFKTSNGFYVDHFIQLAAYRIAIKEWMDLEVEQLEILRFGKEDGEFQTLMVKKPEEIKMFEDQAIRCKLTYDFRKIENDKRFKFGGAKGK